MSLTLPMCSMASAMKSSKTAAPARSVRRAWLRMWIQRGVAGRVETDAVAVAVALLVGREVQQVQAWEAEEGEVVVLLGEGGVMALAGRVVELSEEEEEELKESEREE